MVKKSLNFKWEYTDNITDAFINGKECETSTVDLPHSCAVTPFDYFDESIYQKVCGYRKTVTVKEALSGKRVFLNVGAAAHEAEIFIDGESIFRHSGGYTAFRAEITPYVEDGQPFLVAIKVDSRETLNIPPFGNVIDYMTYGGLYREVYLEIAENTYIEDVFVIPKIPEGSAQLPEKAELRDVEAATFDGTVECRLAVSGNDATDVMISVYEEGGSEPLKEAVFPISESVSVKIPKASLWDVLRPALYEIDVCILNGGTVLDKRRISSGFRRAKFLADGFYLNGRKIRIIGLNRHQSFPFVGYAMPGSIQRRDADILKYELGVNAVRTSHYPQSQHFVDRCDEIGLLVFTEIPGWQHIGDDEWKEAAIRNVKEMVTQYRNHPSVILWGVRINESVDDDDFYKKTNETARRLDPTRQTGGVRCFKKGSLLEDVYTYNDFVHDGTNRGCERKRDVTSDMTKGYLVTEYNGHMFPTKTYDSEEHRLEHALRHASVLDAVAGEDGVAGSFGWCMFDYNTHRDFGSGDRICYHGVCDMFRNPKIAAGVYSEMRDGEPFLEVSSTMDIGEHPAGNRGKTFIFTNADSVKMYKNGVFIREFSHSDSPYKHLKNAPIEIDDFIGEQMINDAKFAPKQARYIKDLLNYSARYGFSNLPASLKMKAAYLAIRHRMTFDDMYSLYGKYIGNWGEAVTEFTFEAVKDGKTVKRVQRSPVLSVSVAAEADRTELYEDGTYDAAAIRIKAVDQNGNTLPYYFGAIKLKAEGSVALIGPSNGVLRGGVGGTYVRTVGKGGYGALVISSEEGDIKIEFNVTVKREPQGSFLSP